MTYNGNGSKDNHLGAAGSTESSEFSLAHPGDPANPRNLPSTEVRELLPPMEDEIHLRDYLDVLIRRKWTVVSILLIIFFGTALFTLTRTPLFHAKSVIKVTTQESKTTNFENLQSDVIKMKEFQQTQINLLRVSRLPVG